MATDLDSEKLNLVFQSRPDILQGIQQAADSPARVKLFNNIATFVCDQIGGPDFAEPAIKRRRVDVHVNSTEKNGTAMGPAAAAQSSSSIDPAEVAEEKVLLEIKDISVSVPQRKKFSICLTKHYIYAKAPNTTGPVSGIIYPWKDIEYAFYLPVPEKTQLQHNYVLFPRGTCLTSLSKNSNAPDLEPLVFTVPAGAPKPGSIGGENGAAAGDVSDSYKTLFHWAIGKCLQAASNTSVKIIEADVSKFHSKVAQPHRPKEKAAHIKAFRGSKDGYLFFVENGILWGYKKPLMFIPLERIAAISYTNILQRTFNIVVEIFSGVKPEEGDEEEETEEIEFAMIDQEDYGGINEDYIARHGLQDRSMADQRKAKLELAENAKGKKGGDGADAAAGTVDGQAAQLDAAQQQLFGDDDDEEDEEDYDPGTEGDSDGSGEESDDDDDEDGDGEGADDDDDNDDMDEDGDGGDADGDDE